MGAAVAGLRIHPVKSTAIVECGEVEVTPAGLAGDRRWMVVDADGECLTARTDRALFAVSAATTSDGGLSLSTRDGLGVTVEPPNGPRESVTVHGRVVEAITAADAASELFRSVLGRSDARLVWCPPGGERALNPAYSRQGDRTAYADGCPVTLASLASLRALNAWIGDPAHKVTVDRFRPNVVIDGDLAAFDEDHWTGVVIGDVSFRVAKPVERCAMTMLDPTSLQMAPEPIRTLARHRRWEGGTRFAIHLIPESTGSLRVGADIEPRG